MLRIVKSCVRKSKKQKAARDKGEQTLFYFLRNANANTRGNDEIFVDNPNPRDARAGARGW